MKRIILFLFIPFLLFGCVAEFEAIGNNKDYARYIGVEYETTQDLLIFGYTLKLEKDKKLDGFAIYEAPGIASGPEILSKEILPKYTVFSIIKIQRCSNCFPLPAYIQFIVKFRDIRKYDNYKVSFEEGIFKVKDKVLKEI